MSTIIPEAPCHRCKSQLPQTEEYFKLEKSGKFKSTCRKCVADIKRNWRNRNPDKVAAEKKRHYELHKDEIHARQKRWYVENIEHNRAYRKQYAIDHAEEARERSRLWYANNKKRASKTNAAYYRRNKKRIIERVRDYGKRNPEKLRLWSKSRDSNRRAREIEAEGVFTSNDVLIAYRSQRGKCWHCGKHVDNEYHADHLVPLAKGGTNNPNNIVVSCSDCNQSKGAKFCYQWNGRLF